MPGARDLSNSISSSLSGLVPVIEQDKRIVGVGQDVVQATDRSTMLR